MLNGWIAAYRWTVQLDLWVVSHLALISLTQVNFCIWFCVVDGSPINIVVVLLLLLLLLLTVVFQYLLKTIWLSDDISIKFIWAGCNCRYFVILCAWSQFFLSFSLLDVAFFLKQRVGYCLLWINVIFCHLQLWWQGCTNDGRLCVLEDFERYGIGSYAPLWPRTSTPFLLFCLSDPNPNARSTNVFTMWNPLKCCYVYKIGLLWSCTCVFLCFLCLNRRDRFWLSLPPSVAW